MKLYLCILSATSSLFEDARDHACRVASGSLTAVLGYGNGCSLSPHSQVPTVLRHSLVNEGVPAGLHSLWEMAVEHGGPEGQDDVLCYIHDDVRILEHGWDERVLRAFVEHSRLGLSGFGGSTGIGAHTIYKEPYNPGQLGRIDFWSNMNGAEVHGHRTTEERPIVWVDGQSMIVRRKLLDEISGWSWWPKHLVHHAYDYGIACMARRHGYTARLVPCSMEHRGGLTACGPVYQQLAAQHGGDAKVHDASHRFVYETFRDVLPLRL